MSVEALFPVSLSPFRPIPAFRERWAGEGLESASAPRKRMWKNTPPSEDGEAMRKKAVNASSNTERRWFAVYTTCRHEKRVARHMEQRQIEHFLPTYRTQHRWKDGSRVMVDLPLFPGYVFVRTDLRNRVGSARGAGRGFDDRDSIATGGTAGLRNRGFACGSGSNEG